VKGAVAEAAMTQKWFTLGRSSRNYGLSQFILRSAIDKMIIKDNAIYFG